MNNILEKKRKRRRQTELSQRSLRGINALDSIIADELKEKYQERENTSRNLLKVTTLIVENIDSIFDGDGDDEEDKLLVMLAMVLVSIISVINAAKIKK